MPPKASSSRSGDDSPVVAEVVRSGFVEARHRGRVVALLPDGEIALALGDPFSPIYPRSANKPLQAAGMVEAGLPVGDETWLAIATASHSGQPRHVQVVRALLASAGLDETDLENTPGLPLDEAAAWELLRAGGGPEPIYQSCSGKHAAMLVTCRVAGWPTRGYLEPAHPVQRAIRSTLETLAGEPVAHVGVDGCGAPALTLSLLALARGLSRMAVAPAGTPGGAVAAAMRTHPDLVGGSGRPVTALMVELPGLLAKDGAEGVFAAAMASGEAAAVKIEDGGARAAVPVLVAGLRALGLDAAVLDRLATTPVLGHGEVVGEVRALVG